MRGAARATLLLNVVVQGCSLLGLASNHSCYYGSKLENEFVEALFIFSFGSAPDETSFAVGLFIICHWALHNLTASDFGGAAEIIATDLSQYRLEMAEQMGATVAIDAGHDDVLQRVREITGGVGPRLVFEASGNSSALVQGFEMVAKRGKLVLVAGHANTPALNFTKNVHLKEADFEGIYGREIWDTWNRSAELVRRRMIDVRPLITHRFPLEKMDEAIAVAKRAEAGKSSSCRDRSL